MTIINISTCDECEKRLEHCSESYCHDCYVALEDKITELEKEIGTLEARIADGSIK